jgi:alpha-tubulin suppressor-like RCC1 family protein
MAWGYNFANQLGDGTTTDRSTPVNVSGLFTGVVEVEGGGYHSLALKSDGTVWAWGDNLYGQLGDGTNAERKTPVKVSGLTDVVDVDAGFEHNLAVKSDGTVWAWGGNLKGQLGDGTYTESNNTPVKVGDLTDVVAVSGSWYHSLALKSDGTVWAWGDNVYGQLGDGTDLDRNTPVEVSGLTGVADVEAGGYRSLALKSDGTVWAWGNNWRGQLGDGTNTDRNTPVEVSGLTGVADVEAGGDHSLALKSDGTVWAWGVNEYGQLGDGTRTNRNTPVNVSALEGVVNVAGGDYHSLALKSDGTVWAWGDNHFGQLGDGTRTDRNTPVNVSALEGVVNVAGGHRHSLAVFPPEAMDPIVSSTTPTSGATGVRRGSSPTATFSEEMNPDTLTTSTVKLSVYNKKKGRYVLVSNTTVRCDSPCYTVTLDPYGTSSTLLAANAKYKVTITTGAKDATGDALAQNKAWTFTTGLGG